MGCANTEGSRFRSLKGLGFRGLTAKPESARLEDAVREIGDVQEIAKELLSAVNRGYLGGACLIASVSVGKSMLAMERQLARLIELSDNFEKSALLNDDVGGGVRP